MGRVSIEIFADTTAFEQRLRILRAQVNELNARLGRITAAGPISHLPVSHVPPAVLATPAAGIGAKVETHTPAGLTIAATGRNAPPAPPPIHTGRAGGSSELPTTGLKAPRPAPPPILPVPTRSNETLAQAYLALRRDGVSPADARARIYGALEGNTGITPFSTSERIALMRAEIGAKASQAGQAATGMFAGARRATASLKKVPGLATATRLSPWMAALAVGAAASRAGDEGAAGRHPNYGEISGAIAGKVWDLMQSSSFVFAKALADVMGTGVDLVNKANRAAGTHLPQIDAWGMSRDARALKTDRERSEELAAIAGNRKELLAQANEVAKGYADRLKLQAISFGGASGMQINEFGDAWQSAIKNELVRRAEDSARNKTKTAPDLRDAGGHTE